MREEKVQKMMDSQGSITVFMTFMFVLFLGLTGTVIEHARVLSSDGMVRVSGNSAAMTVFGDYNRELYQDYGLYAYSGISGNSLTQLEASFQRIITDNLREIPENAIQEYASLYRIGNIQASVTNAEYLTSQNYFYDQIKAYNKYRAIENLSSKVIEKLPGKGENAGIEEKLSMTNDYEKGKYDKTEEEGGQTERIENPSGAKDEAGGNPLKTFASMMRDGILHLVCDEDKLKEGKIEPVETQGDVVVSAKNTSNEMGAADYLSDSLGEDTTLPDFSSMAQGADKIALLSYGNAVFSSYCTDRKRTTQYGKEYLIAGKTEEKDNLAFVVNRILAIRTILNFAYVAKEPVLQEKSLVTATVLAGIIGIPAVVKAVQYTILLILAYQESCVDVIGLMEDRTVPVMKTAENFKMKYEEICMGSKSLFKKKAAGYPKSSKGVVTSGIDYEQYLYLFMLTVSQKELENRTMDLIQYDLRNKYNQAFSIQECICKATYEIQYEVPFLFAFSFPKEAVHRVGGKLQKVQEVSYDYQSG